MSQCETCKNGIFCPTWGDYKCAALHISHTSAMLDEPCSSYVKTDYSKTATPDCHCKTCENHIKEED